MVSNAVIGVLLSLFAGLTTTIGASVVYSKHLFSPGKRLALAGALATASGVILFICTVEIYHKGIAGYQEAGWSEGAAARIGWVTYFSGMLIMYIIDRVVHSMLPAGSKEEARDVERMMMEGKGPVAAYDVESQLGGTAPTSSMSEPSSAEKAALFKMGMLSATAIALHNFPEGMAIFVAAMDSIKMSARLAIGIILHNIPEGFCVSIPVFYATGSRHKAFGYAFLTGLAEPIGALLCWAISTTTDITNGNFYGAMFGLVGGMMLFVVLHEFLPTAHRYDPEDKVVTKCTVFGMFLISLSIILLDTGLEF